MITRFVRRLRQHKIRDDRGSMIVVTAISMTAILGFASMGVDIAMWYQERRVSQNIADAAAVAAAHEKERGGGLAEMTAVATTEAIRNGYVPGGNNELIVSDAAGEPVGLTTPIVDVVVRREVPQFLMSVFRSENQIVAANATAGSQYLGNLCVIGLDFPVTDNATGRNVDFTGNTYVDVACGVHSNSTAHDSLAVGGNATLIANPAQAVGGIDVYGSGDLIISSGGNPITSAPYQEDPFGSRAFPDRASIESVPCAPGGSLDVNGTTTTLDAGAQGGFYRICGDLTVSPTGTLNLEPGVYYVDDGDVLFQGTVNGTGGVTIHVTGSSLWSVGTVDMRAQTEVSLTAPSDGVYAGIAIMQDQMTDYTGDNKFNGGSSQLINGAIYFKSEEVTYNGGADVAGCTFIVARKINFSGTSTSYIRNTPSICSSIGLGPGTAPLQAQVVLVQ